MDESSAKRNDIHRVFPPGCDRTSAPNKADPKGPADPGTVGPGRRRPRQANYHVE